MFPVWAGVSVGQISTSGLLSQRVAVFVILTDIANLPPESCTDLPSHWQCMRVFAPPTFTYSLRQTCEWFISAVLN